MDLLTRADFMSMADGGATAMIHGIAENNRVAYRVGAQSQDGLQYLTSSRGPKAFKWADSATNLLYDYGFKDVELLISSDARDILAHERQTSRKLSETFAKRGSLRAFAKQTGLRYGDIAMALQDVQRARPVQIALAERLGIPPKELWLDFDNAD